MINRVYKKITKSRFYWNFNWKQFYFQERYCSKKIETLRLLSGLAIVSVVLRVACTLAEVHLTHRTAVDSLNLATTVVFLLPLSALEARLLSAHEADTRVAFTPSSLG